MCTSGNIVGFSPCFLGTRSRASPSPRAQKTGSVLERSESSSSHLLTCGKLTALIVHMVLLKNFFAQDTTLGVVCAVVVIDGKGGTLAAGCIGMKILNFQFSKSVGFALPTLKMGEMGVKKKTKEILGRLKIKKKTRIMAG